MIKTWKSSDLWFKVIWSHYKSKTSGSLEWLASNKEEAKEKSLVWLCESKNWREPEIRIQKVEAVWR